MFHFSRALRITRCRITPVSAFKNHSRQVKWIHVPAKDPGLVLKISPEVLDAIETRKPVVALETTIYTHGFPYPDNVALALQLESVVRKNGGVPATIGIIEGQARVGLTADEILAITEAAGKKETMKVSRRDLPYILGLGIAGRKLTGGTTIAGTMFLAGQANIRVFGTGGLGGVHRGGQDTMDISADLTELGRTRVAVVSSGCKSFLDIPRTLEYLETQGAGVFTFADGRLGDIDFPAFWTRDSGVRSPMVVQNEREAAAILFSQDFFPASSGLLFANPIPEEFAMPKAEIDVAIEQAVQEAAEQGIHGHRNTPFVLNRIKDLTKGYSIPANRALVQANVAKATKIAVEYEKFRAEHSAVLDEVYPMSGKKLNEPNSASNSKAQPSVPKPKDITLPSVISNKTNPISGSKSNKSNSAGSSDGESAGTRRKNTILAKEAPSKIDVLVAGSVAIDLSCDHTTNHESSVSDETSPRMHTSNRALMSQSVGGVGHNVALAARRVGGKLSVQLRSLVASDAPGQFIINTLLLESLDTRGITMLPGVNEDKDSSFSTAQYVAVNDARKDLVLAMADMNIFTTVDHNEAKKSLSKGFYAHEPKWIVVDANWTPAMIRYLTTMAKSTKARVAFEPVSTIKSTGLFELSEEGRRPMPTFPNHTVDLATPNTLELEAMHAAAKSWFEEESWWSVIDALGIPSSGARDRFVALTNVQMTDAGIPLQTIQLLPFIPTILTKLGAEGVLLTTLLEPSDPRLTDPEAAPYILSRCNNGSTEVGGVYMRLFPATEVVTDAVSVNGVGDTFLGVLIAGLAKGVPLDYKLIDVAQRGAVMTLRSKEAVSPSVGSLARQLERLAKKARRALVN